MKWLRVAGAVVVAGVLGFWWLVWIEPPGPRGPVGRGVLCIFDGKGSEGDYVVVSAGGAVQACLDGPLKVSFATDLSDGEEEPARLALG